MRLLVDCCYLLLAILLAPVFGFQAIATGKYRGDWAQRTGRMPRLPSTTQRVWIHAVSVGEANAVRGLIASWREQSPDTEFVISTTTDTGKARLESIFGDLTIIRYPLDFSWWVCRALDRIRPTMVVLVELEVWYQFITQAAARGIPVAVVNGRLSERSVRGFGWIAPITRRMFRSLSWVSAQDETYAERFRRMGAPAEQVRVSGSLKWDTAEIADTIDGSEPLATAMGINRQRPLWVCGSTGPGEEERILQAYASLRRHHPELQLAIVPRKPERFDEVAGLIAKAGHECIRRSNSPDGSQQESNSSVVLLGDTMGELRKLYSLADVVFVGRTLADMGGSDMMEVAALAKPTIVGRHTENFADVMRRLTAGDGICVIDTDLNDPNAAQKLADAASRLLTDRDAAQTLADNGRNVVKQNRGATQRTLDGLLEIMSRAQHRPS
jgi:3-deoxy-D-manno-octulosonic-acid transferase